MLAGVERDSWHQYILFYAEKDCMRRKRSRKGPGVLVRTIEDSSFTGDGKDDVRVDVVQQPSS